LNIAAIAIKYKLITLVMVGLMIFGGFSAYQSLGRLEDPEFTVKTALVTTEYPGASALEVEEEVTEIIETAIQELSQIDYLESRSIDGLSTVTVNILDKFDKATLPQVWDELRRKVGDAQAKLPPGVKRSVVFDDYGDVYGILLAITGEGYSDNELEDYADFLKRELLTVKDVAKVVLWGAQQEQVFVEISTARMSQLGVSLESIYQKLSQQNLVQSAGKVEVGPEYIRISPTGEINSVDAISHLLIGGSGDQLIYLSDIATITRGYVSPPTRHLRFDGKPAIGLGISTVSGGNVVRMGRGVEAKLLELQSRTPLGIKTNPIYFQAEGVEQAVKSFVVNLIEALLIVIVTLMIFMGRRSGLIIGAVLLITVSGTLFIMGLFKIDLQRISLGALIIALGMLVDNAIVVVEGMQIRMQSGMKGLQAAQEIVSQTMWPLLGGTAVAVLAFAAIGLSNHSTGEYLRSLFQVMLISLGLSWVIAITVTPVLAYLFLKPGAQSTADPYKNKIFQRYKKLLQSVLARPYKTIAVVLGLLALSAVAFSNLEDSFFPNSTTPQMLVHYWLPQGTDIRVTSDNLKTIEKYLLEQEGVESVSTFVGDGAPRYMLTFTPEKRNDSYGLLIVNLKDYKIIPDLGAQVLSFINDNFLNANPRFERIRLGPGGGYPLEARFGGRDPNQLRGLSDEAQEILRADGGARAISDNWRERVKVLRPELRMAQVERAGLTRSKIAQGIETEFGGTKVGIYREGDKLLPIVSRPPLNERTGVNDLYSVQIWSDIAGKTLPLTQMTGQYKISFSDSLIQRRNKVRTITVQAEPTQGNVSVLFDRVSDSIEAIPLPLGYQFAWGGEHEDSAKAKKALNSRLPPTLILMVLITIILFNALKQPLIIWLTVPLSIIGVAFGFWK
jgi:multidrug efflux pump subunit AcrB